jgi:hypothetical protein
MPATSTQRGLPFPSPCGFARPSPPAPRHPGLEPGSMPRRQSRRSDSGWRSPIEGAFFSDLEWIPGQARDDEAERASAFGQVSSVARPVFPFAALCRFARPSPPAPRHPGLDPGSMPRRLSRRFGSGWRPPITEIFFSDLAWIPARGRDDEAPRSGIAGKGERSAGTARDRGSSLPSRGSPAAPHWVMACAATGMGPPR